MITEDYVSFEIARLLKDKGFNEYCMAFRSPSGALFRSSHDIKNFEDGKTIGGAIAAPTLQTAMKWLREVYNIVISIFPTIETDMIVREDYNYTIYKNRTAIYQNSSLTYEQSCEESIEYTLENLI